MLEQVDIGNHHEEGEECEDQEILHRQRISGAIVGGFAFFRGGKHKRLVGVAESLCDECHDHGEFHRAAVDAELHDAFMSRNEFGKEDFVDRLVENARNAEYQDGPRIGKHGADERTVDTPFHTEEFFPKTEGDQSGADEIDEENVSHFDLPSVDETGKNHEEKEIEQNVEGDEAEFQHGEFHRSALITQIAEGHGLKSVERHDSSHHPNVVRMIGIAHLCRKVGEKGKNEG